MNNFLFSKKFTRCNTKLSETIFLLELFCKGTISRDFNETLVDNLRSSSLRTFPDYSKSLKKSGKNQSRQDISGF